VMGWVQWVGLLALAVNLASLVYNCMLFRRWRRLCDLMESIVIQAWISRHAPIWVPWCAAHGVGFKLQVIPRSKELK